MIGLAPVTSVLYSPSASRSFFQSTPRGGEIWRTAAVREGEKEGISSVGGFGLDKSAEARSLVCCPPLLSPSFFDPCTRSEVTLFGIGKWKSKEAPSPLRRLPPLSPSRPLPLPSISRFESKNTRAPKPINCLRGARGKGIEAFSEISTQQGKGGRTTTQRPDIQT